jgi:flotillin
MSLNSLILILVIVFIAWIIATGYVKAPADKAFIISGLRKEPRYIIGRATVKIPFFERKDEVILQLIQIDVRTASTVPTADYINVRVDSNVNVKVGTTPELLKLSAQNFLGKDTEYIASIAREVLEGNVREIVGKLKLEEMVNDRQKFAELVRENAEPDLKAMGLEIISFNVQNFMDENGVIENLGIDNIVTIKKQAEIAKANSEKEIAKATAQAEKEANEAIIQAQQEIAIRNNELEIKKAELKIAEDEAKAKADAVYAIQEEEQRKTLEIKRAEANLVREEKQIELKDKESQVKEKELDANIKKLAQADKFKRQQEADALAYEKQKEADVEQYKKKKEYEILKEKAEAELIAEQKKAEGIAAVGKAQADAIRDKLLAEAEGLDKKAEAMAKMNQVAVIEMVIDKLPEIAKNVAEPLSKVDKITMYGEGNSAKLVGDIMQSTDKIIEGIGGSTGLDIKSIISGALGGVIAKGNQSISNADNQTKFKLDEEELANLIQIAEIDVE